MEETSSYIYNRKCSSMRIRTMISNNGRFQGEENTIYKAEFINTIRRELQKKIYHVIKIQRKRG